jgi:hypothetical protein
MYPKTKIERKYSDIIEMNDAMEDQPIGRPLTTCTKQNNGVHIHTQSEFEPATKAFKWRNNVCVLDHVTTRNESYWEIYSSLLLYRGLNV